MFQFQEMDTRIFEYSKGERDENGAFKSVFADPAVIKRQLDISLPNRSRLIDQVLAADAVKEHKAQRLPSRRTKGQPRKSLKHCLVGLWR